MKDRLRYCRIWWNYYMRDRISVRFSAEIQVLLLAAVIIGFGGALLWRAGYHAGRLGALNSCYRMWKTEKFNLK